MGPDIDLGRHLSFGTVILRIPSYTTLDFIIIILQFKSYNNMVEIIKIHRLSDHCYLYSIACD